MKTVRFGIIGCGLMGREFGSAAARWCHLPDMEIRPEIVALCDTNPDLFSWYTDHFTTITQTTSDYKELLANDNIDVIYCAVPHNLHQQMYCDIIEAGKHLVGEKPFGIDKVAGDAIMECCKKHPDVFVRCASQFPFHPAVQYIANLMEEQAFGRIIEFNAGFMHASDMDLNKTINWKRMLKFNGEYGCMGDLGMHACHLPFRAGLMPKNVRAILSNLVPERPDGKGGMAPCETYENATLLCEAEDTRTGDLFPMTIKTQRIAPGEKNTWYFEVKGMLGGARFSTKNPKLVEVMRYDGGEQTWNHIDISHTGPFKSITGGIFEFGFSDAILQMWAGFLYELDNGQPVTKYAGCATPEEAIMSHRLFTAALESQKNSSTVKL